LRAANGSRSESRQRRISSLSVWIASNLAGPLISFLPMARMWPVHDAAAHEFRQIGYFGRKNALQFVLDVRF
jgi:hypothetical protein